MYVPYESKVTFFVWAPYSPRAENISKALNAELHFIHCKFKKRLYSPIKYPFLFYRTVKLLLKEKPSVIVCQSPPIFCALSAQLYRLICRDTQLKIVIDCHTGAFDKPWSYLKSINSCIMKAALFILVSNESLQHEVYKKYKLTPFVLEDKIPDFESDILLSQIKHDVERFSIPYEETRFKVAVVASSAPDEPIAEILEAAKNMPDTVFYITGPRNKSNKSLVTKRPQNVIFTGMQNFDTYITILKRVDCIMALTKRDMTLLSGGYEAIALGKPLITSSWKTLQDYYSLGTVHVDNSTQDIKKAIYTVRKEKARLSSEMNRLKILRNEEWEGKFSRLVVSLNEQLYSPEFLAPSSLQ